MHTKEILDHLEKIMAIKTVSEVGSIRRASEVLNISQPSLSVKIKTLEELLGFKIFERSQSGIQLTPKGQILFDFVSETENNADKLKRQLEAAPGELSGHLKVGVYDSIARYLWPSVYKKLRQDYPNIAITLLTGRSDDLMQKLLAGDLDIALTVEPKNHRNLFQKTLYKDSFSCYGSGQIVKDKELFKKRAAHYELDPTIRKVDLILFSEALSSANQFLDFRYYRIHEVKNFEIALEFCLKNIGLAILPQHVAEEAYSKGRLKKVRLSQNTPLDFEPHKISLSIRQQIRKNPAAAAVFEEMSQI